MITIEDFQKVEIRAGKILAAEKVPETDKLLKLSVDFGEETPRQIISGIALHFPDPATLIGITCAFAANLEPRTIRGLESQGMIMATSTPEGAFSLLAVSSAIPPGTRVK